MNKILIIGMLWDGLGDIAFTKYVSTIFTNPDIVFIIKKEFTLNNFIINFIYKSFSKVTIVNIDMIKDTLSHYDLILLIASSYQYDLVYDAIKERVPKLLNHYFRLFDFGISSTKHFKGSEIPFKCDLDKAVFLDKRYQKWNIFTGFSEGSMGIQIGIPKPTKTITKLFEGFTMFTCYFRTPEYYFKFLEFANNYALKRPKKKIIVFMQTDTLDLNKNCKFLNKKIGLYKLYSYKKVNFVFKSVSYDESIELFCYSYKFVGCQGNSSLSLAFNFKKVPLLEWRLNLAQSYCLLVEYLQKNGFLESSELIFSLVKNKNTLDLYKKNKKQVKSLFKLIHNKLNLQKNLKNLFKEYLPLIKHNE